MALTLDPATEQRIQRELARGHFREPAEVLNHALDLLKAEEEWLLMQKEALNQRLAESIAQVERGEFYTPEEARQLLEKARQVRRERARQPSNLI